MLRDKNITPEKLSESLMENKRKKSEDVVEREDKEISQDVEEIDLESINDEYVLAKLLMQKIAEMKDLV